MKAVKPVNISKATKPIVPINFNNHVVVAFPKAPPYGKLED